MPNTSWLILALVKRGILSKSDSLVNNSHDNNAVYLSKESNELSCVLKISSTGSVGSNRHADLKFPIKTVPVLEIRLFLYYLMLGGLTIQLPKEHAPLIQRHCVLLTLSPWGSVDLLQVAWVGVGVFTQLDGNRQHEWVLQESVPDRHLEKEI